MPVTKQDFPRTAPPKLNTRSFIKREDDVPKEPIKQPDRLPQAPAVMSEQTELTEWVHQTIVDNLIVGNFIDTVCALAFVRQSRYEQWMVDGEADYFAERDTPYSRLYAGVQNANARSESRSVMNLKGAEGGDWRAAQAFLERRHPNRWGLMYKVKNEVRKELDRTLEALQKYMSAEGYDELLKALTRLEDEGEI